jgi:hypothetical protein
MQINKSDRNDAVGIARIMQCGWYKEVRVKEPGIREQSGSFAPDGHITGGRGTSTSLRKRTNTRRSQQVRFVPITT